MEKLNWEDRIPVEVLSNGATRYGIYDENGTLVRYEYIKREDGAVVEGTAINKIQGDKIDSNMDYIGSSLARVDRYNIATYSTDTPLVNADILPKTWTRDSSSQYHNGDIVISGFTSVNNAFDGDLTTYCGSPTGYAVDVKIDFGIQYKITKFKTYINRAFTVKGSNDGTNYTNIYSGSAQSELTEFTVTSPSFYRYYQFSIPTGGGNAQYIYEIQTSQYAENIIHILSIENDGSTNYEEQERLLIQTPSDISELTNPVIVKNELAQKMVNGTLKPNALYELVYQNGQYELAKPTLPISIKTGTISHGNVIPQTAGYNNYQYFVSINSMAANSGVQVMGSDTVTVYTGARCSVNQETRFVTAQIKTYIKTSGSGTGTYTDGIANYMEIAWN